MQAQRPCGRSLWGHGCRLSHLALGTLMTDARERDLQEAPGPGHQQIARGRCQSDPQVAIWRLPLSSSPCRPGFGSGRIHGAFLPAARHSRGSCGTRWAGVMDGAAVTHLPSAHRGQRSRLAWNRGPRGHFRLSPNRAGPERRRLCHCWERRSERPLLPGPCSALPRLRPPSCSPPGCGAGAARLLSSSALSLLPGPAS